MDVAFGDFDRDGRFDLASANRYDDTISVLRNTSSPGSISFAGRVSFGAGVRPQGIAIGDFNADGRLDLATADENDDTVSVFHSTSSGPGSIVFSDRTTLSTADGPLDVTHGDFDGDGLTDLATANGAGESLSVFRVVSGLIEDEEPGPDPE